MKDRFINGLVAGTVAGFAQSLTNALLVILHLGRLKYGDFAGIMLYGRKPHDLSEFLFAFLAHLGFAGAAGIAFSFILKYISKNYLWVKGLYFGLTLWFLTYSLTLLYKVPGLTIVSFGSAVSNGISSAVYGLTLAWGINRLERLEKIQ